MAPNQNTCPDCARTPSFVSFQPSSNRRFAVLWSCDGCDSKWSEPVFVGPKDDVLNACIRCGDAFLPSERVCQGCGLDDNLVLEQLGIEPLEMVKAVGNARVAISQGFMQKGLGILNLALRSNPELWEAWEMKYEVLRTVDLEEDGARMLQIAMGERTIPGIQRLLGEHHLSQGRPDSAVKCFHAALQNSNLDSAEAAELYSNIGQANWEMGLEEDAQRAFESALEHNPMNLVIIRNHLAFLLEHGRADEAGPLCEQALIMASDDGERGDFLVLQAFIHAMQGDRDLAENTLELAFSMGHQSEQANYLASQLKS